MDEKKEFKDILNALIEDENSVQFTAEEQSMLDEVMGLLDGFDKNLEALSQAKEDGLTTAQWMETQLRKSVKRVANTEEHQEKLFKAIDDTIENTVVEQLGEEAKQ